MSFFEMLSYASVAVATASGVAAITPTPRDDAIVGKVYKFIDLLALNIGKAKDK